MMGFLQQYLNHVDVKKKSTMTFLSTLFLIKNIIRKPGKLHLAAVFQIVQHALLNDDRDYLSQCCFSLLSYNLRQWMNGHVLKGVFNELSAMYCGEAFIYTVYG